MIGTPVMIFISSLGVPQLPDTGVWPYLIPSTRCAPPPPENGPLVLPSSGRDQVFYKDCDSLQLIRDAYAVYTTTPSVFASPEPNAATLLYPTPSI
jgi:hypothetical protein